MADITIGSAAIDRDSNSSTGGYTIIGKENPANGSGKITAVKVYAYADLSGLKVGIFYLTADLTLKCRSASAIGDVVAGAARSFIVDLNVVAGDFIGFFFSTGTMEVTTPGGAGIYYKQADMCVEDYESVVSQSSGYTYSLGGEGDLATSVVVVTEAATGLTTTGGTLNGSAVGLSESEWAIERGFEWGTTQGDPYTGNWSEEGEWDDDMEWSHDLSDLESGIPIFYRAMVKTAMD